ncbi:MAG: NAD(P)/FAD-dependent oxidoreductase [Chloroflexi bacterium]|nr:NAD(P)/FAD-dependent oxidoreductase [Chloroflexota bacterium]
MHVGIIGGGVGGLAAAYDLARAGFAVSLFEREHELGGEAGAFPLAGTRVERFYHHLFTSDTDAQRMLGELGLADRLRWLRSRMGLYYRGQAYPFGTPLELLRCDALAPLDRLRIGLAALYLQRLRRWRHLERQSAAAWVYRYAGPGAYHVVWGPLLRGKFGAAWRDVSMAWLWNKLVLRGTSRRRLVECLGYIDGSFQVLIDGIAEAARAQGARIATGAAVQRVVVEGGRVAGLLVGEPPELLRCDAVIATVPSPIFLRLAPDLPADYRALLERVRYQGALCLVLELRHQLTPYYWLNVSDRTMPFVAVVEHTNLYGPEHYHGRHIVYLSNYLAREHLLLRLPADDLLALFRPYLRRLNPAFTDEWLHSYHLFRDPGAQPIVTREYGAHIPPHATPIEGLYLANTTQIYPEDRGTNYSIRQGRRVARMVADELTRELILAPR